MSLLAFFRCSHAALSRVFTIDGRTYRVCLNCGVEREYSLDTMQETGRDLQRHYHRPDSVALARSRNSKPEARNLSLERSR